ncbi:flagellar hook-associated protein 1 FlgK [Ureibacillus xyleni]|uniref:Flagellar hook-associated protein 1 n=1 Tax=Ureibacillus xyleni TaxID=614648 RepID=A0A285RA97_9BACL|nr:flagellar hook-associated protein FlgK [Ureibacillus xyleni]SOB91025.1 flagellar hook-associated protein 1 FlgK [Ureibacillus xyleni]
MRSTFMGLEASKRGLFTQQSALYTTGHNISNANTEGYTRQRVNMSPTQGYPGIGLNTPKTAGHIGTGVQADSVQRIRDEFIDRQYRQETNKLGYWESRTNAITQMEDIMSEPSEYGLNEAFNLFWKSMQDVSTNSEDSASRKVAIQRAEHLADSFNYIDTQLKRIQGNLGNEISVSTTHINSILKQIGEINKQIQAIEPNGYMPNDLYDARDNLVDKLNEYLPVTIERVPSGGNALDIAEGSLTIKYKTKTGDEITLVNGKDYVKLATFDTNGTAVDGGIDNTGTTSAFHLFDKIQISALGEPPANGSTSATLNYEDLEPSKGKLVSLIDSYGHSGNKGYYPEMLQNLDKLAKAFVTAFNEVHAKGFTLGTADKASTNGGAFFNGDSAANISVNNSILTDPNLLAASSVQGEEGNGKWAIELANLQFLGIANGANVSVKKPDGTTDTSATISADLEGATFQAFYRGLIGQLGVDGEESSRLQYNTETIRLTVQNNKASMSSVSLDEEMTNMITFQQAYNANARMITVIDETLDKIINGMGRVGL